MLHPHYKIMWLLVFLLGVAGYANATQARTNFLTYGPSAAAAGMGEANVAYASDAGAIYYNPALMYNIRDQVTVSHWFLYDGAQYNFIGLVVNNETSAFGLGGTQFYRDNIEARETISDVGIKTQNSQMAAYGSYAGRIEKWRLAYGASLKWLRYSMYNTTANGINLDFGLAKGIFARTYSMGKKLAVSVGARAANVYQTGIKMDSENEKLPMNVRVGVAATTTLWPKYDKGSNKLSYDDLLGELGIMSEDGQNTIAAGLQYTLQKNYIFRAGYNRGGTVGLGYKWGDLSFDYAFIMKELSNFHRLGFSYSFGTMELPDGTMPITDDFQKVYQQATRLYERFTRNGEDFIKQGRPQDARLLLLKAIPLNPKNNSMARDLLAVSDKAILGKKTGALVFKANEMLQADTTGAYLNYLEAYKLSGDVSFLNTADAFAKNTPALEDKRKAFTDEQLKLFDGKLNSADFTGAKQQLELVKPLVDAKTGEQLQGTLEDRKNVYVSKLVAAAMDKVSKGDMVMAHRYFKTAYLLNNDTGIKDQMAMSEEKYFTAKKYSVEDKIYADKLYYKMVCAFATDDKYQVSQNELAGFNPFYDLTEFTDSLVVLGKKEREILIVE